MSSAITQNDGSVVVDLDEIEGAVDEGANTAGTDVTNSPDGSTTAPPEGDAAGAGADDGADAGTRTDDDDDDDDVAAAPAGETVEAKRERRRLERQQKRERARAREDNFRNELAARDRIIDEMRERMQIFERRNTGADIANLDARIRHEESQVTYLKQVIADGTASQNGQAVAEATQQMLKKLNDLTELQRVRQNVAKAANTPAQPQLDQRMVLNASNWMSKNSWYNPAKPDADTNHVLAIDQRLADEGYNPSYPEYWEELQRRVDAMLPHRASGGSQPASRQTPANPAGAGYNPGTSQRKPSRSVVTGAGGAGSVSRTSPARSFVLSAERVQALKDAGMWDDPKARSKAIKNFMEYDSQHAKS